MDDKFKDGDIVSWKISGRSYKNSEFRYRTRGKILFIQGEKAKIEVLTSGAMKTRVWKHILDLRLENA